VATLVIPFNEQNSAYYMYRVGVSHAVCFLCHQVRNRIVRSCDGPNRNSFFVSVIVLVLSVLEVLKVVL
jgi:hypothetical protein